MTNSLLIGKHIYARIAANEVLQDMINVEEQIYPLVADNDAKYPYIIYRRTSIVDTNGTKDGYNQDKVTFDVIVVSDKYSESALIANEIRKQFHYSKIVFSDMIFYNTTLSNATESFDSNAFIQKLTFNTDIE